MVDGHTIKYECYGEIDYSQPVKDGDWTYNDIVEWIIYDKYGNDVTYNYEVTTNPGKLTLIK